MFLTDFIKTGVYNKKQGILSKRFAFYGYPYFKQFGKTIVLIFQEMTIKKINDLMNKLSAGGEYRLTKNYA